MDNKGNEKNTEKVNILKSKKLEWSKWHLYKKMCIYIKIEHNFQSTTDSFERAPITLRVLYY